MTTKSQKISAKTVCDDFNDPVAVVHYARAAKNVGLWKSERRLIERFFPDPTARMLEAGCGAGRGSLGLWELGFRHLTAFDFAEGLLEQAYWFAGEKNAVGIHFHHADATKLTAKSFPTAPFDGILFLFNGLMQIPGRRNRRKAMRGLRSVARPGATFLFTTHDRASSASEKAMWRLERLRWERGEQDPKLVEFGDRYFKDEAGRTFMHLPDREEILADLKATGWVHTYDCLRRDLAIESATVVDFSDECRFWVATNGT